MKKLFTLLLFAFTAFTLKSNAQTNTCNADFTFSISSLSVTFTPAITVTSNIHSYWRFGDGAISSDASPVHLYAAGGSYTVTHIVYRTENGYPNAVCVDSVQKKVELSTTVACNLQSKFSFERDAVQTNKVKFTNLSSPAADIKNVTWTFGDGTSSTDFNATHVYTVSGLYHVCLLISKSDNCRNYTCMDVQVQVPPPPCNIEAKFETRADSADHKKIYFTNTSTPAGIAVKTYWSFGDGTASSDFNPTHVYASPGTYNVCLRVIASNLCYKELCKTIEVKGNELECKEISKFSFTRSTVNCLEFKFVPANQNPNWKYVWNFGDGSGSTDVSPSHVYPRSGNYTVILTAYRSANCVSTSYQRVETGTCFSCNNIWLKYEYLRAASSVNSFYFHALSNYPILSQTWTITKLSNTTSTPVVINQNNPYYTFTEPGDYRVCVKAITQGQCVKEYCEVIHINAPVTECTLQIYPNPTHNQISVAVTLTQTETIHVYIYNSLNVLVAQKEQQGITGANVVTTNIESLVIGWYTIKVISGNKVCYSKFQKI